MLSPSLQLTTGIAAQLQSQAARVVVIGPSGWLGQAAIAMLDRAFPADELKARLLPFGSHARTIITPSGVPLKCRACDDLPNIDVSDSVILHFGYLTKDKAALMSVDDYVSANDAIQDLVLRAIEASPPRALFFASSGAVYQGAEGGPPSKEGNLYGWMKARHEAAFRAATARAGVTFINGRIFTLAGEFINKTELYAIGSILSALKGGSTVDLRSARPVVRSYTYVGDVINLALALMLNSRESLSFDMAGAEPIEIGDLARLCAKVVGKGEISISRPQMSSEAPDSMIGHHEVYHRLMASHDIMALPIAAQIAATATYLGFEGLACT